LERLIGSLGEAGRWLLVLTFFVTPMVTLRLGGSITLGDFFLALSAGVALLLLLLRWRLPELPVWILGGGALLILSIVITVVFPPASVADLVNSYYPSPYSSSPAAGLRFLTALIVLPLVTAVLANRRSTLRLLVWAWIAGVCLSCLVAVIDGITNAGLQISLASDPENVRVFLVLNPARYVGLGVHPTSFSVTAAMVMPVVLAKMTDARRVMVLSPVLLVLSVAIVLSGSRVGYIGVFVVVGLSLWLNPVFRRVALTPDYRVWGTFSAIVALCLALFIAGPPAKGPEPPAYWTAREVTVDPKNDVAAKIPSENRTDDRLGFLQDSVDFVADRPFGGYGYQWIESAHNIYLQLLVSGGILGLAGFLWVYLGYIRRGLNLSGRFSGEMEEIRLACTIALGSYLVMGFVQTDLLDRYLYLPAGLILALSALTMVDDSGAAGQSEVSD